MEKIYLFVYGSLKRNFQNHYIIEGEAKFINACKTENLMSLYRYKNFNFPYLTKEPKEYIYGELYEISEELLKKLDRFEDYPNMYIREKIKIMNYMNLNYVDAWAYILNENITEKDISLDNWSIKDQNKYISH